MIVTEVDLNYHIRKVALLAKDLNLDLHHGSRGSLEVSSELKKICKTSPYYREVYDYISTYKQYNLMLKDQACFQFSEFRNKDNEQELRYAYYPNPYQFVEFKKEVKSIQDLYSTGELSDEDYQQLINEAEFILDIPLIRYDYSPSQYEPNFHPASHFHIGFHSENRWPVQRVLNPSIFFTKIIAMYYTESWKKNFELFDPKTLNDLYSEFKSESYAISSNYIGPEDKKRLLFF